MLFKEWTVFYRRKGEWDDRWALKLITGGAFHSNLVEWRFLRNTENSDLHFLLNGIRDLGFLVKLRFSSSINFKNREKSKFEFSILIETICILCFI